MANEPKDQSRYSQHHLRLPMIEGILTLVILGFDGGNRMLFQL